MSPDLAIVLCNHVKVCFSHHNTPLIFHPFIFNIFNLLHKNHFDDLIVILPTILGNEPADEDVDIVGGNDQPVSSFPPVEIEKDAAHRNSKCSNSSSSSSDSGSSSSGSFYCICFICVLLFGCLFRKCSNLSSSVSNSGSSSSACVCGFFF